MSEGKRMTSSRRHHLKSLMLQIAASWLEQEAIEVAAAKEAYMAENCAAPDLSADQAALVEICKKLHQALDKIDEDRYDAEAKVAKTDKEIEELKLKVVELAGVKKPALKKVRMSADAMLQALLGGKHKVTMDLRANLKQVKKEVKEEVRHSSIFLLDTKLIVDTSPASLHQICSSVRVQRQSATGVRTLRTKLTERRCSRPLKDFHIQLLFSLPLGCSIAFPLLHPIFFMELE
uniref:Troponin I2, fast skeletal type n=1 Tax=Scophthalmus maximus TaxID=52904 RepID=A0A8D3CPA2_SCOMX